jgi:hypothetical protein
MDQYQYFVLSCHFLEFFFNETPWFEMVQMATIQDPLATIKDISFKSDMVICVSSGTIIWLLICDLEK